MRNLTSSSLEGLLISNYKKLRKIYLAIGEDAFNTLLRVAGGEITYLPKAFNLNDLDKKSRNANIKQDYYQGMSITNLIAKYQLSRATIYKAIERK